jgi:hypothetical protein
MALALPAAPNHRCRDQYRHRMHVFNRRIAHNELIWTG